MLTLLKSVSGLLQMSSNVANAASVFSLFLILNQYQDKNFISLFYWDFIFILFFKNMVTQGSKYKAGYIIIWFYKSFKQTSLIADQIHFSS